MPEKISPDTLYLRLESINPAENRFRYYVLILAPTLWQTWALLCEWGRLDQAPRGMRILEAESLDAAHEALARAVRLRERRGYERKQPPG